METITSGSWKGFLGRGLAPRELECLLAVAQGMTAKEIARLIDIAPGTVVKRLSAAMFKLGVQRRPARTHHPSHRRLLRQDRALSSIQAATLPGGNEGKAWHIIEIVSRKTLGFCFTYRAAMIFWGRRKHLRT
ncbi:helix-turn-helix transcriptional regulator [Pseudomonas sp. JV241A]|uniref:response regulator transcription factor n=1 Tax=Pseudomonas sp. JV241A TaxID=2078785 RepID=UPI00100D047F|nr:helix-turn-helix transcriptional regulator [Pseudomonas sp. JV241A]SPO67438.1 protein of unknown function [Pseudomonas sp. JV241A]